MIQFFVEDVSFDLQELTSVPSWLTQVVSTHQASIANINYIFCSDKYLLHLNRDYLSHNYYTDIITFDNRDDADQPIESDIFVSVERVQENSERLSSDFFSELLRVLVHGVLHLLGFLDSSDEERSKMRELENEYITLYFRQFHSA